MRKRRLYELARHGRIPAEELHTDERELLVAELHGRGWSDRRIATHTRETEYTVERLRHRLGLSANRMTGGTA